MGDRGILFSAPMVRALLAGRKTQTRRLLRNPEYYGCPTGDCPHNYQTECDAAMAGLTAKESNGFAPGDRLWVREAAWIAPPLWTDSPVNPMGPHRQEVAYAADDRSGYTASAAKDYNLRLRSSIHLPRWASRLTLIVTDVRVQRLQAISEADARAEGVIWSEWPGYKSCDCNDDDCVWCSHYPALYTPAYHHLWSTLHTKPGERWEDDPWVVAVSFDVRTGNIDAETPHA